MKKEFREALIEYVRDQLNSPSNFYNPTQWVSLMNSYARHDSICECARKANISHTEAQLLYCRFAIAMAEYSLRPKKKMYPRC